MTIGFATTAVNSMLNGFRNVVWQNAATWVQVHTGDPGDDGTSNVCTQGGQTRSQATFAAAAGGSISLTGTNPHWDFTGTETLTHVSVWTASTAGSVLWSAQLGTAKTVGNGDTYTLTACGIVLGPLMAD